MQPINLPTCYLPTYQLINLPTCPMRYLSAACFLLIAPAAGAWPRLPKPKVYTVGLSSNATATPFGKFAGLLSGPLHPGIDFGAEVTWRKGARFSLFQSGHAGYFYHRFVQHGILLYTQPGLRYGLPKSFYAEVALMAGYQHSIPATGVYKRNDQGEYEGGKGIGRPQGMFGLSLGLGWIARPAAKAPLRMFIRYKQRLQTPFVRSYVPLLPYNVLEIGIGKSIAAK
jgi:hypothetical protein